MTSYDVGELAPLNLSISRANQHVMRINLRRMELSAFIELISSQIKRRTRAALGRHRGKGSAVLGPAF